MQLAGTSYQSSTISFDPIPTTQVGLEMTSRSPGNPTTGNLTISEVAVIGDRLGR